MLASAHLTLKTSPDRNSASESWKASILYAHLITTDRVPVCTCARVRGERSINEHVSRAEFRVIKAVVKEGLVVLWIRCGHDRVRGTDGERYRQLFSAAISVPLGVH